MKYALKFMSLSEILDQSTNLLKNHFKMLMIISAYMMIPLELVDNVVTYLFMPAPLQPGASQQELINWIISAAPALFINGAFLVLFALLVWPVTEAAVVHAIASEYLGQPVTPGECLRTAFKKFGALIGTGLLKFVIVCAASLLFLIPGLYFLYKYYFSVQAVVIEEKSGYDALKRSGDLMNGNFGTAFALGLVLFVVYFVGGTVANFVPSMLGQLIVRVLISSVLFTYSISATVIFYFSCRCKLENFDLTMLADAVNAEVPAIAAEGSTLPQ